MGVRDITLYADITANTQSDHQLELVTPIEIKKVRVHDSVVDSIVVVMVYADEQIIDIVDVVTDGEFLDHSKEKIVVTVGQGGSQEKDEIIIAYDNLNVSILGDANDTVLVDIDYVRRPDLQSIEDRTERLADVKQITRPQTSAGNEFWQVGDRLKVSQ